MIEIDLKNVYQAIEALKSPDPRSSTNAAQWLDEFKKSVYSWTLSDQMLGQAVSHDACVLAAQIIRQKVLSDFRELPENAHIPLRDSILNHLCTISAKFSNTSSILVQLAAALSDLFIQVGEWRDFGVETLIRRLYENSPTIFLIFFKTLPEELYNRHLRIGENRRGSVENELASQTETFLTTLSHICESSQAPNLDPGLQSKVIYCLSSWLINKRCPTEIVAQSPLFSSILNALKMPNCHSEVHDAATECIINALYLVEEPKQHPQMSKLLHTGISDTVNSFRQAMENEDYEKLQNYSRIYAELCESFITDITSHPGEDFGNLFPLHLLLLITEYHDYGMTEMTFNIWYRLSEYLYQCEDNDFEELRQIFRPYIERYILALCKHCRIDLDIQGLVDPKSEISEFRAKASESVKDVTFIVGSIDLLKNLMNLLNTCQRTWDEMEAILFVISSFIHNIVEDESVAIPLLLNAILEFSTTDHPQLLCTSIQLLGNLHDWLHANTPYLERAIQWLFSLTQHKILLKTISETLEQICEKNYLQLQAHHREYFDCFSQLLAHMESSEQHGQDMEAAAHHLLRASTHLINDLPVSYISNYLEQLCARPLESLHMINSQVGQGVLPSSQGQNNGGTSSQEGNKENQRIDSWQRLSNDPMLWLDRLAAIFRVLKPWHNQMAYRKADPSTKAASSSTEAPWLEVSRRALQIVSCTLETKQTHQRTVEHACRAIRFIIRSIGSQSIQSTAFNESLAALANQIMGIYASQPHSCFLYLASILVDEYGAIEYIQPGLVNMLKEMSATSFTLLQKSNGLRDHPDTVDDLYRLAIRFIQRAPRPFFHEESISAVLLEGAVLGLSLDHTDANRSISKFVLEIIDAAKNKKMILSPEDAQRVNQMVQNYGAQLIYRAIIAALFHLSNSLIKEMAEIIYALYQFDKERAGQWLGLACSQILNDYQGKGPSATIDQIEQFRTKVLCSIKPYEVLSSLRELSKFYS